jgi:hypothetical protein
MSGVRALIREAAMIIREAEISRSRSAQRTHQKQTKQQRKQKILEKRKALLDLLPAKLNDSQVLTFKEWCALNRISERNGRRIVNAPGGPTLTQISARHYGVTVANNRAWQRSRERVS